MSKQRLLFITTGGTIASVRTQQGLKPVLSSEELLAHLPELKELCCPETLALCSIDSTDLGQEHWLMMARAIQENYALYDGFIICHGTDTLAYSAAALSYLIQNADKPIILTGAQQPISNEIALKEALKGTDVEAIKKAQEELQTAFYAVAERIYKEQGAAAQQAEAAQTDVQGEGTNAAGGSDDNVVDADYTDAN